MARQSSSAALKLEPEEDPFWTTWRFVKREAKIAIKVGGLLTLGFLAQRWMGMAIGGGLLAQGIFGGGGALDDLVANVAETEEAKENLMRKKWKEETRGSTKRRARPSPRQGTSSAPGGDDDSTRN